MERAFRKCKDCGHKWSFIRRVMGPNPSCDHECPGCGSKNIDRRCENAIGPGRPGFENDRPDPLDTCDVPILTPFWQNMRDLLG